MNTPITYDTYAYVFADLFDIKNMIDVSMGFQSIFGNPVNGGKTIFAPDAEALNIELEGGDEKMSALIPRGINGTLMSKKGVTGLDWTNISRVFPLSEEEGTITAAQINKRVPGEPIGKPYSRALRKQILAGKLHAAQTKRQVRMFEYLAAQSFLTGKQDAIISTSDPNQKYDFRRHADMTFAATGVWSNTAYTGIFTDIDKGCDRIRAKGRIPPRGMIVDGTTMDSMLMNTVFQQKADNRRFYDVAQIGGTLALPPEFARMVANGFVLRGKLMTPAGYELFVFTYNNGYDDDSGNFVKYMPANRCVLFAPQARYDRWFGPPEMLTGPRRDRFYQEEFGINPVGVLTRSVKDPGAILSPEMFWFDAFPGAKEKSLSVRTQTAPVFGTIHPNSVAVITGT